MDRRSFCAALGAASLGAAGVARAQPWPSKPIRLVMPYPPGGGGDLVLRPLIAKLHEQLGENVLIDYKPGASTIIGTEIVAKAPPDGYTIGFITNSHSINPIFRKQLPYDSAADFAPITLLTEVPLVLITHPSLRLKTLQDFVAHAKAQPGKLAYASLGFGGPHYIAMEWLKYVAGIDLLHVPYQGSAPGLAAVVGGQVQTMFVGASTALQFAKDGRVDALATSAGRRLPAAPQLPTVAESGYREFDLPSWYGLVAPARTPPEIVARLSQEVGRALRSKDLAERLEGLGLIVSPTTPEGFAATLRQDAELYAKIIRLTGARGE